MPQVTWNGGGAQNTAQVDTFTGTAVANGGTWTLTMNAKDITYTMTSTDTIATAIVALLALLQASDVPAEFGTLDYDSPTSTTITATANEPGTPFTMTKSQSGGATCTLSTTTANSSGSDVTDSLNWLRSGVAQLPQNGDDMVLANSSVPLLWNLDGLSGVLLNSFSRYQSFTGSVGLPESNPLGYIEYRPTYLILASNINPAIAGFAMKLGSGPGQGPTRERYDMQSYRTTLTVLGSGSPTDAYSVRFLGSHGQNTIATSGVSVGVAMLPTEVSPFNAVLNTATVDQGGTLDCGAGCSFSGTSGGGTLTVTNASATMFCTPTIVARNNATVTLSAQDGVYSSVTATNGTQLTLTSPMTITVLTLAKSSTLDNSNNVGAVTITASTLDGDTCQINDPYNGITYSNATSVLGQVTSGPFVYTGQKTCKIT